MDVSGPPWQAEEEWSQVDLFFKRSMAAARSRRELNRLAQSIAVMMSGLERAFDSLCAASCPVCTDNCCMRATVWYDFRDLLFYYCLYEKLPSRQIVKKNGCGCTNLQTTGCILPRLKRPFVCTWYLCPVQMSCIRSENESLHSSRLKELLDDIQRSRKELEQRFLAEVLNVLPS